MTHPTYTQQALSRYDLPRLKRIATELGITPTLDKRGADTWINAILTHQSTQLQKTQSIPPEKLTTVEISFYDHEIYAASKLIGTITHDDNLTQPWVVIVNGVEQFRANTWARCHRFIQWHLNNSLFRPVAIRNYIPYLKVKSLTPVMIQLLIIFTIANCELRIANCLKHHAPQRTESWRIFSTSARITGLPY